MHNATGFNDVLLAKIREHGDQLVWARRELRQLAAHVGTDQPPNPRGVVALRFQSEQLAGAVATLDLKTAGGQGCITTSDTTRSYREASSIPLQAPSEAQLQ